MSGRQKLTDSTTRMISQAMNRTPFLPLHTPCRQSCHGSARTVAITLLSLVLLTITLFFSPASLADAVDDIIKRGELRVGVSEMAPWVMKNRDGKLIGFEIDVANQLARDMGVKVKFSQYAWKEMIPALENGEIDLIASGLSITPQRALRVNYSQPYATSGYSLVTNLSLTRDFKSVSDLNDEKIYLTAVKGTVSADLAMKVFPLAKVELRNTVEEASAAVVNGTVHGFISSSPVPEFIALKHPRNVDLPLDKPLLTTREAFAVEKGHQELLNFLNAWIVARKADKWIRSTHEYWFNSLKWQRQVEPGKSATKLKTRPPEAH